MSAATVTDGRIESPSGPIPEPGRPTTSSSGCTAPGLNRADLLQRAGDYPAPPGSPPDIPGLEFAGEVEAVGSDGTGVGVGDRVFGIVGGGAQAEYVARARRRSARRFPTASISSRWAASPRRSSPRTTRWSRTRTLAAGEWVLVHAVGSRRRHRRAATRAARSARASSGPPARPTSSIGAARSASTRGIVPPLERRRHARRRRARVRRSSRRPTAAPTSRSTSSAAATSRPTSRPPR